MTWTITDNEGATDSESQNISVTGPATGQHVGDLDRSSQSDGSAWAALVTSTVDDADHLPVGGVSVTGSWTGGGSGSANCDTDTDGNGQCPVTRTGIRKWDGSVQYEVTGESATSENHDNDPDGDSNGTTITVLKP